MKTKIKLPIMTQQQLQSELSNYSETETFAVTLKSGGEITCRRNPKGTKAEVVSQTVTQTKSFARGDIVEVEAIESID